MGIWQLVRVLQLAQGDVYVKNIAIDIFRQGQVNNLPPDQSQPWSLIFGNRLFGATVSRRIYSGDNG
jgi:beta-mannosidase